MRYRRKKMDKTWLYENRIVKADIPKENKDDLRKRIDTEVTAYINSGGQIQRCPPCTYSKKVNLTVIQKKKVNRFFQIKGGRKRKEK
jgi:hypothetical protein|tara:strand:+ start:858 stop:1118 length:261 start_codon:yes stop_codon:yes gene_type:complete